jgi:formylglycine-generating enzyme required for sulfatase activity
MSWSKSLWRSWLVLTAAVTAPGCNGNSLEVGSNDAGSAPAVDSGSIASVDSGFPASVDGASVSDDARPGVVVADASDLDIPVSPSDPCALIEQESLAIRTKYCAACHSPGTNPSAPFHNILDDQVLPDGGGGTLLTQTGALLDPTTGQYPLLVVPGDPDHSLLYERVAAGTMPPRAASGQQPNLLPTASDISILRSWIFCLGGLSPTGSGGDGGVDGGLTGAGDGGDASVDRDGGSVPTGNGLTDCGPNRESCATSLPVPSGTFYRSYDGVTYTDTGNPATVSGLRLDKYEISVGRFRQFVSAVVGGWLPAAGSGKHTHLNQGQGLADSSSPGSFETGWNSAWNNNLARSAPGWSASLSCQGAGTWTASAAGSENLPINCTNWYQAYAFCIWDGGFLPSEAEWNYTASGGSEQRVYPWSSPPSAQTIDCTRANLLSPFQLDGGYVACAASVNSVGSESPRGDGKWGQADLTGNVAEWNLDWYANYAVPCTDCGFLSGASQPVSSKVDRGGSAATNLGSLTSDRPSDTPTSAWTNLGARCARTP